MSHSNPSSNGGGGGGGGRRGAMGNGTRPPPTPPPIPQSPHSNNGHHHHPNQKYQNHDTTTSSTIALTTENWLELFLTTSEKRTFAQWTEHIQNKSFIHSILLPLFDTLVLPSIPPNISPNIITMAGCLCLLQAWYISNQYGEHFPTACTWFAIINILFFFVTNQVDLRHSARIRQSSALVELFKYSCDCCSTVFLVILTTYCLGGTDVLTQWYAVQASQLVLFTKHLSAFHRNAGLRYNVLTGPGEVLLTVVFLLVVRGVFGLDWIVGLYDALIRVLVGQSVVWWRVRMRKDPNLNVDVEDHMLYQKLQDPVATGAEAMMMAYYIMYVTAVVKCLMLKHPHGWSRFGLSASLLMRAIPAVFLHWGVQSFELTVLDVICDGFFMAVLTTDVTLAKMAGREVHPWVVLMSTFAILNHPAILALVVIYYIAVFADLCSYLNMPLMTVCRNVYCDGVYDLCHIGHKTLFRNALSMGNRLFVGVVNDKDASGYKRPPIMTHEERCAEVEACKSVTKVIPNAPCFGITQQFLDEHQIHVVAYGEEYLEKYPDADDDPYYGYVRRIGIAQPQPRTKGLSTSDLMKRIQASQPADSKNSPT